jgi:hypothetical protein
MKKEAIRNMFFFLLAFIVMCGMAAAEVVEVSFAGYSPGDSIEGVKLSGHPITITSTPIMPPIHHDAVVVKTEDGPLCYRANNASGPNKVVNGCLPATGAFSDGQLERFSDYTITFDDPIKYFSLRMYDYGDWNYYQKYDHTVRMVAYDSGNNPIDESVLDFDTTDIVKTNGHSLEFGAMAQAGDACDAEGGEPGNWTFEVSGSGIMKVKLFFEEGTDPAMALGLMKYELDDQDCPEYTTDLIAGGGNPKSAMDAGNVTVWSDGTTLFVLYETEGDWMITSTHVDVACDIEGDVIPQSNDNPTPGQFQFKSSFKTPVPDHLVQIDLTEICCENPMIAAHADVKRQTVFCDDEAIVYGINKDVKGTSDLYGGFLFEVDLATGGAGNTPLFNISSMGQPPTTDIGPNGLAYDAKNDRHYYCNYSNDVDGTTTLYFWSDAEGQVEVGQLLTDSNGQSIENIAAASFYNGKYYFIAGDTNNKTDNLYSVALLADGTMDGTAPVFEANISNNLHGWMFNGDIAIDKNGVLYGWGSCGVDGNRYEFFHSKLDGSDFEVYTKLDVSGSLQLAFASNGTLVGHSYYSGKFYAVNLVNGSGTEITGLSTAYHYTDIASGALCKPQFQEETGWGEGYDFDGSNWAMYFNYSLHDCYEPSQDCEIPPVEPKPGKGNAGGNQGDLTGAAVADVEEQVRWLGIVALVAILALAVTAVTVIRTRAENRR